MIQPMRCGGNAQSLGVSLASDPVDDDARHHADTSRCTRMKAGRQTRPSLLRLLGPGLVTGAADDDPSGIATYSQAGAQFGFTLCWTMFLTLPFMVAIQIISATIGWQSRRGLASNLAQQLPSPAR
jgi:Mn2+/Fe2+ NRAMP family transporter